MAYYIEVMINGLLIGALYSMVALGFVLIYKASDILNFAQGEFVMFAGYVVAFTILTESSGILGGGPGVSIWIAVPLALVVMVAVGYAGEYTLLRQLVGQPVHLSRTPASMALPPPEYGEHTNDILGELGLGPDEIAALRDENVI